jgi:predicted kinase
VAPFLRRYLDQSSDLDLPRLLPFYQCDRALVRAKVHALRLKRWNEDAARYFEYARRFQWQDSAPFLLLVSGFSGSGKSTLARALGPRLGALVISSDEVRKGRAGSLDKAIVPLNEGIYSEEMTARTYDTMAEEADRAVAAGQSVIADGTFGRRDQRARFLRLAERRNVPLLTIRCMSSDAVTAERLRSRAAVGADISDGRWEIYLAQKAAYEPMDEIAAEVRFDLCTEAPIEELVGNAEAFLRERLTSKIEADPSSLGWSG